MTDWARPLPVPVRLRGGQRLSTLAEVRTYIMGLPEAKHSNTCWLHAVRLLIAAAEGGDLPPLVAQVELALFYDGQLGLSARPFSGITE